MQIIDRQTIAATLDLEAALDGVQKSFRLYSAGRVTSPPVAHLGFVDPPGDCHIKSAHLHGESSFAVKVSNGFYENPARGLPSSNGLIMVFCAQTGAPLALLLDEGLITDMRTALAGVVATSLACPDGFGTVGIIGTGIQARLQLEYLHRLKGPFEARVWGRTSASVDRYLKDLCARNIDVQACATVRELCGQCQTLITTTPSTKALIESGWVAAGTHITAIGADAEGKQELDPGLYSRARGILVDSREQCADHAESQHAVRAGLLRPESLVELGTALDGAAWQTSATGDITIADLSGLGASDAMMAQLVLRQLGADPTDQGNI